MRRNTPISRELRHFLKIRAAVAGCTMRDIVTKAIVDLLDKLDAGAALPELERFEDLTGATQTLTRIRLDLDPEVDRRLRKAAAALGIGLSAFERAGVVIG